MAVRCGRRARAATRSVATPRTANCGDQRERNLDEEDGLPAEERGEDAPGGRAERGAEDTGADPEASPPVFVRPGDEQRERGGHDERRADPLDAACREEDLEPRRDPAGERRRGEDRGSDEERASSIPPRHVRSRQRDERQDEVERRQHPGDGGHAHVEVAEDLGESQGDDRGVREREPDGETEQTGTQPQDAQRVTDLR